MTKMQRRLNKAAQKAAYEYLGKRPKLESYDAFIKIVTRAIEDVVDKNEKDWDYMQGHELV